MKGNRIKELREARGLEPRDIAVALEVSELTVRRWERGRDDAGMGVDTLQALADFLKCTTDEILGRSAIAV